MPKLVIYNFIYLLPLFFSAIFSLNSFRLKWADAYKVFSLFLISSFLIEIFAIAWKWFLYRTDYWTFDKSNLWIYNFFLLIRVIACIYFYYQILNSSFIKKIIRYSVMPIIFIGVINYFFVETPNKLDKYAIIFAHLIITILCLLFFRQVLREKDFIRLRTYPPIWISLGLFLYHSATLPFFIFLNYLIKANPALAISCLAINQVLNTIMYTLFLISFLCNLQFRK